ncbi:M24 family metallopeptidase [Vibrio nitrifigilis]|nr:aminopeptidase P family protein [Vibrio nitrifigilis]
MMILTSKENIALKELKPLQQARSLEPVMLTDETMQARKEKVLTLMKSEGIECMVIYGDLEHGANFEYLTGFLTRFEEGLLVLHQDGRAFLLLGNENLNKASKARLAAEAIHVPFLSLPNQPMQNDAPIEEYFKAAGLTPEMNTALVGWKMFTSSVADNQQLFDSPYFLVDALRNVVGASYLSNRTDLLIGADQGARTTTNANEIAHYEFGAQLANQAIMSAIDKVAIGTSEMSIGNELSLYGQPHSVVSIAATGARFEKANLYPTQKTVSLGDPMSLTVGYKGGLSSRAGYAVSGCDELPPEHSDYLDVLAKPYFAAVVTWLENIRIGMAGSELYNIVEEVLPKAEYNWSLNPGHLVADEEWMSSPIYPDSKETLKSGMMLQIDIIPGRSGYAGTSCESGVVLADEMLKAQIKADYPELHEVFAVRRQYMLEQLNIQLSDDVLLMNDSVAYYNPFLLAKEKAFVKC